MEHETNTVRSRRGNEPDGSQAAGDPTPRVGGYDFCKISAPALLLLALAFAAVSVQGIVINEAMFSNGATLQDENGDWPDWIELHNPGSETVALDGFGLSDDANQPFKWTFGRASIGPREYRIVFASGKDRQPSLAASKARTDLPGLRLWLSAGQIVTNSVSQVRIGAGAIFLRQWTDRSGQANHASQSDGSRQPVVMSEPAGAGVRRFIRFDGSNDSLRMARVPGENSFTLTVVFRTSGSHEIDPESASGTGGTSGQRYLLGAAHGGASNGGAGLSAGNNGISVYEHGSGYMPALTVHAAPLKPQFHVATLVYRDRRPSLYVDGNLVREGLQSSRTRVTAPVDIGSGAYGSFPGDVAEVVVFGRALPDEERRAVEEHLAREHSIQLPTFIHTSFSLSAGGEELLLTNPDGTPEDHWPLVSIPRDVSWGRLPDAASLGVFFREPTPGQPNLTPGSSELLQEPQFSHRAGFFTNSFELTLTVTNREAAIRYTTDGSDPAVTSTLYSGPLAITNRSTLRNRLSLIPTVPGYQVPAGTVYKGIVVRARAFKEGALESPVVTRSYFVHPRGRSRYSTPVVSLSTAEGNFFDARTGIYVPGNAAGGNYSQRGEQWERPVHVELFESDGSIALSQLGDVKIHGNTSQGFPIKGLDLDGTGGGGRRPFRHRIFPDRDRTEFEHILLRPSGHDHHMAFMRDEMMQGLAEGFGAETQAARLAVVFINGEYWGLHYLKEKEDEEFVAHYGGTSPGSVDFVEGYAAARAGETRHYDDMIEFLRLQSPREPENYARLKSLMEVPSYLDYKISEIFCYRWDIGNHRLWRPRTPEGRWRWLQFDNDVGWGGFWAVTPAWSFNMLNAVTSTSGSLNGHNTETTTFLLRRLLESETFKRDFINRFADLVNTVYDPANAIAHIDRRAAVIEPEMSEHAQRWRTPASLTQWRSHVQYLREYARNRPQFARQHVVQKFGLAGLARLSLELAEDGTGTFQVNTIQAVPRPGTNWTGTYFRGVPIRITALPAPGFRFLEWQGSALSRTNSLTVLLNGDATFRGVFERIPQDNVVVSVGAFEVGSVLFRVRGNSSQKLSVEMSVDLENWAAIATVSLDAGGAGEFTAPVSSAEPARFYRLRAQ